MFNTLINLHDCERKAKDILSKEIFDFFAGGSLDEKTLQRNLNAFADIAFIPRVLRNVANCKTQINLLGLNLSMPVIGAPMALQCLAHPDGEIAMANALHDSGLANIASMMASQSLETMKAESQCHAWFQLYIFKNREITLDLLTRAEQAGYQGIVITVDVPVMGKRERDIYNQFHLPKEILPKNFNVANELLTHKNKASALIAYANTQFDCTLTWEDVAWIKLQTKLPLILKGIAHPDDVLKAIELGVDAIIISNHGGRQLDHMLSSIELLMNVREKIKKPIPVIMDGGIRRGSDILKALLLGANAVLVGRPLLWGLAIDGKQGVMHVLSILNQELLEAMMLTGITDLNAIDGNEDVLSYITVPQK